jgi:hypothetical protein
VFPINASRASLLWRRFRPVPGFSPTHVLHARGTSPFGEFLSSADLGQAWLSGGGIGPVPPWFLLGSRDTPTGTLWHLAFTPLPSGVALAGTGPVDLLPDAVWVHRLQGEAALSGWAMQETPVEGGRWLGLWDGSSCLRLALTRSLVDTLEETRWMQRRHPESFGAPKLIVPWRRPDPEAALRLLETNPDAQLLPDATRAVRLGNRDARRALLGLRWAAGSLALVTLILWGTGMAARAELSRATARTRGIEPEMTRLARLDRERAATLDSLQVRPELLAARLSSSRWMAGILDSTPPARLDGLHLENGDSATATMRLDLEVDDWNELNPLLERLRRAPGVRSARFEEQGRSDGHVRARAVLTGACP